MSAAHTPGPWWVTDSGVRDSGGYICHTKPPTHYPDQNERYAKEVAERKANARLIAAAPELLQALRRAVLALAFAAESSPAMQDDYEAVSAVIAKATGGAA